MAKRKSEKFGISSFGETSKKNIVCELNRNEVFVIMDALRKQKFFEKDFMSKKSLSDAKKTSTNLYKFFEKAF